MNLNTIRPVQLLRWASALLIVLLVMNSKVRYNRGDTMICLLTSQALLERGDVDLKPYEDAFGLQKITDGKYWMYGFESANGKILYNYPAGTSVLCMPFVAVARMLGMDMVFPHHDEQMQMAMSAFICAVVFLLLVRIARRYMEELPAILAALFFFTGSTLISTMSGALWSHNFTTLFVCLAVLEILKLEKPEGRPFSPILLGVYLFATWFCRPTALAFVAMAVLWVIYRQPGKNWKVVASIAVLFGIFVLFSLWQYGRWIPKYYDPSWWKEKAPFFSHIPEYLFSPARGLFLFTPLLLFAFGGYFFRSLRKNLFYTFLVCAFAAHLLLLSRHVMWYGGWTYGPRFFTEIMPVFFVALVLVYQEIQLVKRLAVQKVANSAMAVCVLWGLFVHSWQGLFNSAVYFWEGQQDFLRKEEFMAWNWRFPQFMASEASNRVKQKEIGWHMAVEQMAVQSPAGASFLIGSPDPDLFSLTATWNRRGYFAPGKVYNNLAQIYADGVKDFYFYNDQLEPLKAYSNIEVTPLQSPVTLGAFIEQYKQHTILLSVKDEGSLMLSPQTREVFRGMGSRLDSLKFRDAYIGQITQGKLVFEEMGHGKTLERDVVLNGCGMVKMVSSGKDDSDKSEITYLGLQRSVQRRGFNAAVINDKCEVIRIANFDTPVLDEATGVIFHGHIKD